jgi:chemotaxis protein MotB
VQAQSATARLNDMQAQLTQQTSATADAQGAVSTLRATIADTQQKLQQDEAQLAQATAAAAAAKSAADTSNQRVTVLQTELTALEDRAQQAESDLAAASARLAQDEALLASQKNLVAAGNTALTKQKQLTDAADTQIALLNEQMAALRAQLQAISSALQLQENQGRDKDVQIADLGRKLNLALAAKVQELQRYRSDFFGQLRQVLQNQPNIKIVGDRFVFQSDVLFASNSADLTPAGQVQIDKIGAAIKSIMKEIPPGLSWMLRVDGHADSLPITGGPFKDNWQLSAARAIAVVQLLILDGVPPNHLAATAFADTQPIDPEQNTAAYARKRRIEFRLTDR